MPDNPNQTFITHDGSSSLMSARFGEAYHSRYGALEESNHVFIDAGLNYLIKSGKNNINILEIGFGTGLNAILTLIAARDSQTTIHYSGIDAYPISLAEAKDLNYPGILGINDTDFIQLHELEWDHQSQLGENFTFLKHQCDFEDFKSQMKFDLIYFDAFAPSVQAHLWEVPFLDKIYKMCNKDAVLVTYCAKGSFKRALKECGFRLESLPGPAKKREMTRAIKIVD